MMSDKSVEARWAERIEGWVRDTQDSVAVFLSLIAVGAVLLIAFTDGPVADILMGLGLTTIVGLLSIAWRRRRKRRN